MISPIQDINLCVHGIFPLTDTSSSGSEENNVPNVEVCPPSSPTGPVQIAVDVLNSPTEVNVQNADSNSDGNDTNENEGTVQENAYVV